METVITRAVGLIPKAAHPSFIPFNESFMANKNSYRVGIVGATGAVGQELIALLRARAFPLAELRLLASSRSAGRSLDFGGQKLTVQAATPEAFEGLDVVFFAAGTNVTKELAPEAVKRGCLVIDKSSAFRMDPTVPLVIPEINANALRSHQGIIASPNCSTTVALMALYPLHRAFGLKRVIFSTYQSVSGTGADAVAELEAQVQAYAAKQLLPRAVYPHQIFQNLIPHIDAFGADGYTGEETKMRLESRKILGLPDLKVTATCIRVPVVRAHSVAINAEFELPLSIPAARQALATFPGVELSDEPAKNAYPTPLAYSRQEKCGVGRIRLDTAFDNGLALWVSGDNLWKGAALNAIQIVEKMLELGLPFQPPARSTRRGQGCILVVDDEATVRRTATKMLEANGFEVVTANDGREAVAVYRAEPDRFALVLIDLSMPQLDGAQSFLEMRGTRAKVQVVLMSGFATREVSFRFKEAQPAGFLQKPFTQEELLQVVGDVLTRVPG